MFKKISAVFLVTIFLTSCADKIVIPPDLASQMRHLNTDIALIVNSKSIDQYPLWAPDGSALAANIGGIWAKFDLSNMKLKKKKWGDKIIGTLVDSNSFSALRPGEINEYRLATQISGMRVRAESGDIIYLDPKGFSTTLAIIKPGQQSRELWSSKTIKCHDLSLSPNENFAAYMCDGYGVFVVKLIN